jgi:hypothetical protein
MPQGVGTGTISMPMPTQDQVGVRPLESQDEFAEARLEAIGFVFHGTLPLENGNSKRPPAVKTGTNLLHFARCAKLEKAGEGESKIWYRTIAIAKAHLDESIGNNRWKWCKVCEREITQRILNER